LGNNGLSNFLSTKKMNSPVCVAAIFTMTEPSEILDLTAPGTIDLTLPDTIDLTLPDTIDLTVEEDIVDLTMEEDTIRLEDGVIEGMEGEGMWTADMTEARLNEFLENHDTEVIVAVFGVGMMQILTNPNHLETLIERGVDFFFDYIQSDTFTP
jgi:hypothetical protein